MHILLLCGIGQSLVAEHIFNSSLSPLNATYLFFFFFSFVFLENGAPPFFSSFLACRASHQLALHKLGHFFMRLWFLNVFTFPLFLRFCQLIYI